MDRPIDPEFRKKQIVRRTFLSGISVVFVSAMFVWGPGWMTASINRSRIRTATVDVGPIESTITAAGTVVPELEKVLSSPIDARVIRILKRPGAVLSRGDPIVELDTSESTLALERVNQALALKENQQSKTRLDLQNTLINLQSQWDVKHLELQSLKSQVGRNRQLFREGLLSEEVLRQSELQQDKVSIELKQLEDAKRNAHESTRTQIEGLSLEMKTLQKEQSEARRVLNLATAKSDRNGVLTWVVAEEGAALRKGEVIARIADLHSFRVDATISDVHAKRLRPGLPVSVRVNDSDSVEGTISNILPTIQNGIITLQISLKEKSSPLLRSNLRVDVLIITERKNEALRIKKGPFINGGEGTHDVFVIRGETAVRRPAEIGISSFDQYEVVGGLLQGDEVIISDMGDYMHLKEVKVK